MLSIIGPPYSSEFVTVFLPLVQNDEIISLLVTPSKDDPVSLFLGKYSIHCLSIVMLSLFLTCSFVSLCLSFSFSSQLSVHTNQKRKRNQKITIYNSIFLSSHLLSLTFLFTIWYLYIIIKLQTLDCDKCRGVAGFQK